MTYLEKVILKYLAHIASCPSLSEEDTLQKNVSWEQELNFKQPAIDCYVLTT